MWRHPPLHCRTGGNPDPYPASNSSRCKPQGVLTTPSGPAFEKDFGNIRLFGDRRNIPVLVFGGLAGRPAPSPRPKLPGLELVSGRGTPQVKNVLDSGPGTSQAQAEVRLLFSLALALRFNIVNSLHPPVPPCTPVHGRDERTGTSGRLRHLRTVHRGSSWVESARRLAVLPRSRRRSRTMVVGRERGPISDRHHPDFGVGSPLRSTTDAGSNFCTPDVGREAGAAIRIRAIFRNLAGHRRDRR